MKPTVFAASIFLLLSALYPGFAQTAPAAAAALTAPLPRLVPDPRLPGPTDFPSGFDAETFARISLVASGADDARIPGLMAKLNALADNVRSRVKPGDDERVKSETILAVMYEKAISTYSEFQTRVDVALDRGEYNCVSSALIFYYLAKTQGLAVGGVETPNHAFCTVAIGGKNVDVETTNPYGFDPGTQKDLVPKNGTASENRTAYVIVPQTKYYNRKPADERRMLSLAYGNRISRLESAGKFFDAVPLAVDSWKLQGARANDRDLAERFMNYATSLAMAGREGDGIEFIRTVRSAWGDDPRYADYAANAAGSLLNAAMKKNDFDAAFAILDRYNADLPAKSRDSMAKLVTVNFLQHAAETIPFAEALAKVAAYKPSDGASGAAAANQASAIPAADYENVLAYLYAKEADRISKTGAWLDAAAFLDNALRAMPNRQDLARQRTVYRQNYAIEVHNRAAKAWNAGDQEGARAIIRQGLEAVPDSQILANDRKTFIQ
jgi:hypothetical protein